MDRIEIDETRAAWLAWAMDDGAGERPAGDAPWWASAIVDRRAWRDDVAWLRWARGELDAFTVAAVTTGRQPVASAPSWARDLLWARWARGAASEAEVVALLGFDPGADLAELAPDWARGS